MKNIKLGIIGATGLVGRTILDILLDRMIAAHIDLYASAKSANTIVHSHGKDWVVQELSIDNMPSDCDIVLMSAGSNVSKQYTPLLKLSGAITIDNSSQWRQDLTVPLIVPEVNPHTIHDHSGIISNPNCSTIQCVVALHLLHQQYGIRRIVYNTYQAVSGAGNQALSQLDAKTYYYDNTIPQIDALCNDGYTKEEHKMIFETQKIFDCAIPITATTVRVPVRFGHCVSINIQLDRPSNIQDIHQLMHNNPHIVYMQQDYPTPQLAKNKDQVYVGRLRQDHSMDNCYNMWVVADNIRKGAATNAVQISQLLVDNNLV
jgi:aspartate-semialdehyde dehydrogenase